MPRDRETAANRAQILPPRRARSPVAVDNYKPRPALHCAQHPLQAIGMCPGGLGSLKEGRPAQPVWRKGSACLEEGTSRVRVNQGNSGPNADAWKGIPS